MSRDSEPRDEQAEHADQLARERLKISRKDHGLIDEDRLDEMAIYFKQYHGTLKELLRACDKLINCDKEEHACCRLNDSEAEAYHVIKRHMRDCRRAVRGGRRAGS